MSNACGVGGKIPSLDLLDVFLLIQTRKLVVFFAARTLWLMLSCRCQGAARAGCSLRDRRPGPKLDAMACRAGQLQPVSVPYYWSEVSRAGMEMVPSIRHSLVVAR